MPLFRKSLPFFAAIVLAGLSSPAFSEDLSGPEVKALIEGKTVYLSTPFGVSLPLNYRAGGVVSGDVSGISAASMFAPKEDGKWWIQGNSMCQQWPTWYKGKQFCFTIQKTGDNKISWLRDDGTSGTATIGN